MYNYVVVRMHIRTLYAKTCIYKFCMHVIEISLWNRIGIYCT